MKDGHWHDKYPRLFHNHEKIFPGDRSLRECPITKGYGWESPPAWEKPGLVRCLWELRNEDNLQVCYHSEMAPGIATDNARNMCLAVHYSWEEAKADGAEKEERFRKRFREVFGRLRSKAK